MRAVKEMAFEVPVMGILPTPTKRTLHGHHTKHTAQRRSRPSRVHGVSPFRVATWRRAPPKRLRPLVGLLRLSLGMERSVHSLRVPGLLSSWPPGRSAPSLSDKRPWALLVPCVIQALNALFFCLARDLSFLGQTPRRWQAIVLEPPLCLSSYSPWVEE